MCDFTVSTFTIADLTQYIEVNTASCDLIRAVNDNNLEQVVTLSKTPEIKEIVDSCGDTLIHIAVRKKNFQILEHLLSLEVFDLNRHNDMGRTPLLIATCQLDPLIAKTLIEKGAEVNLSDWEGNTPLHYAIFYNLQETCVILLEKGADVDARNNMGLTPLHSVCSNCTDLETLSLLLYHGAHPTLRSFDGVTPFEISLEENKVPYQEILLDYIIDDLDTMVVWPLLSAMKHDSPFVHQILDKVAKVEVINYQYYHRWDTFFNTLVYCRPELLKIFFQRFSPILQDLQKKDHGVYDFGDMMAQNYSRVIQSLYVIYSDAWFHYFLEDFENYFNDSFIFYLVNSCKKHDLEKKPLSEIILHMLSYGAQITNRTVDAIYHFFGDGEFFRILLHMDIHFLSNIRYPTAPIPWVIYEMTLTNVLNTDDLENLGILVHFFANRTIRDILLNSSVPHLVEKGRKMPLVPSLLELARNSSRKYIMKTYKVQKSSQFYTILNSLPICKEYKAIIGLQRKLYSLE